MKSSRNSTSASTSTRSRPNVSPSSRHIKKLSEEQKQRKMVEETLRHLVGGDDETDRLELILSTIEYIRNLERQLKEDKENEMQTDSDSIASDAENKQPHHSIPIHNLSLSCKM
ncbi:hypothetical protein WR25_20403 [Diploscapter pachys]|uniref:BHLH domain-containing protein n=1 Tax=Diploscapter pachys TaxID=2018661 RepID=A0A2A2JMC2_9BILA|nr:hypothetical protein WR25_20403 [Diploscapter pachys]